MTELTREKLLKYRDGGYMTVGRLKEFLTDHQIADEALVVIERVEDAYYEKPEKRDSEWGVYLKDGEGVYHARKWNKDIKGKYLDKEQYPRIDPDNLVAYTEDQIQAMKVQYHPAWCCVKYNNESEILFIDLHY